MPHHRPRNALGFPRFAEPVTFCRLPHTKDLDGVDVALVGIPFDSDSNNRVGARLGPRAVREASQDFLREYNPGLDVSVFDRLSIVDWGDAPTVPGDTPASFDAVVEALAPVYAAGVAVGAVGGDHAVSLPQLRALRRAVDEPLSLVLLDAHTDVADTWMTKYNHGTQFRRAVEEGLIDPERSYMVGINGSIYPDMRVEVAQSLGFAVLTADEAVDLGVQRVAEEIRERVDGNEVFLSFDVDVLDAAFAPGSGALEVGGFTPREALRILRGLSGVAVRAFDIVEVAPAHDPSHVTAVIAANVLYNCLGLVALRDEPGDPRQGGPGAKGRPATQPADMQGDQRREADHAA